MSEPSLLLVIWLLFLEVGRDRLHDLLGLAFVVTHKSVKVAGCAELELGDKFIASPVLLDSDLFRLGKVGLLLPHNLDEFLQIFDFSWLNKGVSDKRWR